MKSLLAPMLAILIITAVPALAVYEIGDTVDDFTLLDLQGAPVSLSDFSGQVVLINFFATWCPPCNDEVPLLQALYEQRASEGLVVLGVDLLESPDIVIPWVLEKQLTYPIVISPDWSLFQLFPQAGGFPYNAVIDRSGVLKYGQYGINMDEITTLVEQLLLDEPVPSEPATFSGVKALYR